MNVCGYCGGTVKRRDIAAAQNAEAVFKMLIVMVVFAEQAASKAGRDDPDAQELDRFVRNGAGLARANHDAAHGDYGMARQLQPQVDGWVHMAMNIAGSAKDDDPEGFAAATRAVGGFAGAGTQARWMIDNLSWSASGEALLPSNAESEGRVADASPLRPDLPEEPILCPVCESDRDMHRGVKIETAIQNYLVSAGQVAQVSLAKCYIAPRREQTQLASDLYAALETYAEYMGSRRNSGMSSSEKERDFYRVGLLQAHAAHDWCHDAPALELPLSWRTIADIYRANDIQAPIDLTSGMTQDEQDQFQRLDWEGLEGRCKAWLQSCSEIVGATHP